MENMRLMCPCAFGLESVLSGELKRLGAQNISVCDGRVELDGGWNMVARANLCLRTAERVYILLAKFRATDYDVLMRNVENIPLEKFIFAADAFPVKGYSLNSELKSVPGIQSRVKKAAVNRLMRAFRKNQLPELGSVHQLCFAILKDDVSILLDTTGVGLHKRGYRKTAGEAPIKETLAAGILDLARIYPDTAIYDPFCGSGTFLIEAALKAKNIAPGINRHFAAERWTQMPKHIWSQERINAKKQEREAEGFIAIGSDIDPSMQELVLENAEKAGVPELVKFSAADFSELKLPERRSLVVCNPPYGERLADTELAKQQTRTGTLPPSAGRRCLSTYGRRSA